MISTPGSRLRIDPPAAAGSRDRRFVLSIVCLIPVLGREERLAEVAHSLHVASPKVRLVFICSQRTDDLLAARATNADVFLADWAPGPGDFARKIDLGYKGTYEEWIFQGATDISFTKDWDKVALECAEATGALVVGTNDMANPMVKRGRHSTHTLIARSYCDDPGASFDGPATVFSTAYDHQYVDTELLWLAERRGVLTYCRESIVRHHHPFYDRKVARDETYDKGLAMGREDRQLFLRRQKEWLRSQ